MSNQLSYYGFYKDPYKLRSSSSGGAATAFSEAILKLGGVVIGVSYSKDFYRAEFKAIEKIEDLHYLKGSKYFATDKKILIDNDYIPITKAVEHYLKNNKIVLFIGLGCDVASILNYCKINNISTKQLFTIDLFCHGPTYQEFHENYIKSLEERYKSKIIDFTVRYKKDGWVPPYIKAVFENRKEFIEKFYDSNYGIAFSICLKSYCYNCGFKGDNHPADVTIGDYWGVTKDSEEYNPNGVSVLIVHNNKGEKLINLLEHDFFIHRTTYEKAVSKNSYLYRSRKKNNADDFLSDFRKYGLNKAVKRQKMFILKLKVKKMFKKSKLLSKIYRKIKHQ